MPNSNASPTGCPQVIVITDIEHDIDDAVALVVLALAHRKGEIRLRAIITTLKDPRRRAVRARLILSQLDISLKEVPVGVGSNGTDKYKVGRYEFSNDFSQKWSDFIMFPSAQGLIKKTFREIKRDNQNASILCLASLRDTSLIIAALKDKDLSDVVRDVHIQGGIDNNARDVSFLPDQDASNISFDHAAAKIWYKFLEAKKIPTTTYTRFAAYEATIPVSVLEDLNKTQHPVGKYLYTQHIDQEREFYNSTLKKETRKKPRWDQEWFLKCKASWKEGEPYPNVEDIHKHLSKLVVYDAIAAVGCIYSLDEKQLRRYIRPTPINHVKSMRVVGWDKNNPGVVPEKLRALIIEQLSAACQIQTPKKQSRCSFNRLFTRRKVTSGAQDSASRNQQ